MSDFLTIRGMTIKQNRTLAAQNIGGPQVDNPWDISLHSLTCGLFFMCIGRQSLELYVL
jgi:hypothetical protein